MQIGLAPVFTAVEKERIKTYLTTVLADPHLCNRRENFPFAGRLHVYVDGNVRSIHRGSEWLHDGTFVYIGTVDSERMPRHQRLAIIAAIITSLDLWDAMVETYSTAVSRTLLEQYNTMMNGLLVARGSTATGLALNADRSMVAARMGTGDDQGFYLPGGEQVNPTTEEGWVTVQ